MVNKPLKHEIRGHEVGVQADFPDQGHDPWAVDKVERTFLIPETRGVARTLHEAADTMGGLQNGDVPAALLKPIGAGQPRNTSTDDDDVLPRCRHFAESDRAVLTWAGSVKIPEVTKL